MLLLSISCHPFRDVVSEFTQQFKVSLIGCYGEGIILGSRPTGPKSRELYALTKLLTGIGISLIASYSKENQSHECVYV